MKRPISFASIGDCCIDIYPTSHKIFPGGTALNAAIHSKIAGANTSIFSAIAAFLITYVKTRNIPKAIKNATDAATNTIKTNTMRASFNWTN